MTEMMNETGGGDASAMLDEVLAEPSGSDGMAGEGLAAGEGGAEASSHTVPLATFLGMRDEAKAAGMENAELRRIIAMMQQPREANPAQLPEGAPDPASDPEGYAQYMAMLEQQAMQAEVQQAHEQLSYVETSLDAAKAHLGGENFHEAYEMARAYPAVAKEILLDPNPGSALVEFHHYLQHLKSAAQNPAGAAWGVSAPPPAVYRQASMPAPLPSLAGARGGNASALAPLISDDPIDDILR